MNFLQLPSTSIIAEQQVGLSKSMTKINNNVSNLYNTTGLRILTQWSQTGCLFTSIIKDWNLGLPRNLSNKRSPLGTSGLQVQHSNHSTMLSLKIVKFYLYTVSMPVVFYCNFELPLVKKVKVLKSFSQLLNNNTVFTTY